MQQGADVALDRTVTRKLAINETGALPDRDVILAQRPLHIARCVLEGRIVGAKAGLKTANSLIDRVLLAGEQLAARCAAEDQRRSKHLCRGRSWCSGSRRLHWCIDCYGRSKD